jgi:hypothetical protein
MLAQGFGQLVRVLAKASQMACSTQKDLILYPVYPCSIK